MKGRWDLKLGRFRSRIGEDVKRKAERVTQTVVDRLIANSPVYRGRFRASWTVSEGFPVFNLIMDGSPESPLPPPRITVKANRGYPIFFITNAQPYGQILEYGNYRQAPYAVVRQVIAGMR